MSAKDEPAAPIEPAAPLETPSPPQALASTADERVFRIAADMTSRLCALAETFRTDYDAEEARRLGLGPSAYCYRLMSDAALVALESPLRAARDRQLARERSRRRREHQKARVPAAPAGRTGPARHAAIGVDTPA
jgi:hypothetical protein